MTGRLAQRRFGIGRSRGLRRGDTIARAPTAVAPKSPPGLGLSEISLRARLCAFADRRKIGPSVMPAILGSRRLRRRRHIRMRTHDVSLDARHRGFDIALGQRIDHGCMLVPHPSRDLLDA
jgi:hypothetical protein